MYSWLLQLDALSRGVVATNPPDVSLSTLPTVYYGANWNRSQINLDVLARFEIVILMQEDGHCWATCCPDRFDGGPQCGPLHTATDIPGCNASCAQHAAQSEIFSATKASAVRQKRREPHAVLYMNSVYLWPFDAASAEGTSVQVLDTAGAPHMESCDPGIYPSYFWDFTRKKAQDAWLAIIQDNIVDGPADGVYNDCDGTIPIRCPAGATDPTTICEAKRNGKAKSVNENVTLALRDAYVVGKNATMTVAAKLVGNNGTFYNKNSPSTKPPTFGGGNLHFIGANKNVNPSDLIKEVTDALPFYPYLIVGRANDYSNPKAESLPTGQNLADGRSLKTCKVELVAAFLLAVEPGVFLLCNGWDDRFDRPLGLPTGKAVLDSATLVWSRSFASGVVATWNTTSGVGAVAWPGHPPTPSPPHPSPPPTPTPAPPSPTVPCPGPKCPPVPASNYEGCFNDKREGCDLPCRPPGGSGHCIPWGTPPCVSPKGVAVDGVDGVDDPPDSVERCNQLCLATGATFKYFGLQAGHACFCGMAFGSQGSAPEASCDQPCKGNHSQMCGGSDVNSVWAVQPL